MIVFVLGYVTVFKEEVSIQREPEVSKVEKRVGEKSLAGQATMPEVAGAGNIDLVIEGFKSNDGVAKIFLYDLGKQPQVEGKDTGSFINGESTLYGEKIYYQFSEVPFGEYAVKVYHDENRNEKLDADPEGVPKESLGFSENVQSSIGRANIESAKFSFHTTQMLVKIQMN